MRSLGLAMAMLLVVVGGASAGPLDLKQVSAEARWLVLVDVDGIRTADGWRQGHEQFWEQNGAALGPLLSIVGLDLKNGWHGATIYATQVATEKNPANFRGAAIVSLDFDRQRLVEKLKILVGDKVAAHGPHQIYHCQMSADGENKQTLSMAIHPSKAVVVSTSAGEVERALDVLDGKAPNITQTDSSLATAVPVGTLLLARGLDLEQFAPQFESPLLKQCKSLSLALGERDGQLFADGQAWLKSTDTAEQIEALFNGFRALVQLQGANQQEVAKWLGRIQCVRNDKVVSLSLRLPAGDLQALLENGGKIEVDTKALGKLKIEEPTPGAAPAKPGIGIKYNIGLQVGSQPPAGKPAEKPAEKSEKDDKQDGKKEDK